MSTITDVANEAKVSVSTVSRVLNNSVMVTEQTRNQVYAAIQKVGYTPPATKRSNLVKNKVVLVVCTYLDKVLFDGIRTAAQEYGYSVLFNYIGEGGRAFHNSVEILRLLQENVIGGIILINNLSKDPALSSYFGRLPIVQIGEYYEFQPTYAVCTDDFQASYDMTRFLIEKGRRRIAFIGSGETLSNQHNFSAARLRGYRDALRDNGIEVNDAWISLADYSADGGADAVQAILQSGARPDAVFCVSDTIAIGCMKGLAQGGLKVPDDVAVAGFDNSELAELCTPGLTTVAQSFGEIAAEAVRMLDMLLSGGLSKGRITLIRHEIVEREST